MADLALLITMFVVCGGIGLPLAGLLPRTRFAWRPLLAPVFGFALLAVAAPVAYRWGASVPTIFGGACVLAALSLIRLARPLRDQVRRLSATERRMALAACLCVAGTTLAMLAPRWVGGDQFAVFQGNQWDTFGYLESAVVYARAPYSAVSSATDEQIIRNPLYDLAKQSLTNRPSAHLLYGVFSRVLPGEAYRLYYAYLVGAFVLLVLVGLFVVRSLIPGASPAAWAGVALAYPVGFWGQYAFDINSWSQVAASPVLLLMAALVIHAAVVPVPPRTSAHDERRFAGALAIVVAGALFVYPEGFIFYALALAAVTAAIVAGRKARGSRVTLAPLLPVAAVGGAATAVLYPPLLSHLLFQVTIHSGAKVDWWRYFQSFFHGRDAVSGGTLPFTADFVAGLFGLYFATPEVDAGAFAATGQRVAIVGTVAALLMALALFVTGQETQAAGERSVASDSRHLVRAWIAAWTALSLPAVYLTWDGNYWPAGKAVSYAAPVFMMLLALPSALPCRTTLWRPLRWVAIAFVVFQIGSGLARIKAAAEPAGIHYAPPYPSVQDPALKTQLGWDLTGLEPVLIPETRVLIRPMDAWQERVLMVFLWSRNTPFAVAREVVTGFGSNRTLGTLPPPWLPDVEISAEPHALRLHFRDGRELLVATGSVP